MKYKLYTGIFSIVIVTLLFQSCHDPEAKDNAVKDSTTVAITEVTLVKKGRLSSSVNIPGELQPFQQVDLYAKVNSYVKQLYVDVGSEVKQGQLLAVMD